MKIKTRRRLAAWRLAAFDLWMTPAALWAAIGARLFGCDVVISIETEDPQE